VPDKQLISFHLKYESEAYAGLQAKPTAPNPFSFLQLKQEKKGPKSEPRNHTSIVDLRQASPGESTGSIRQALTTKDTMVRQGKFRNPKPLWNFVSFMVK
jgi:hypothetical protein